MITIRTLIAFAAALPVAAQSAPLTLTQAVQQALKQYPAVRVSETQVSSAAAAINLARTSYLPRADFLAQINRATHNNVFGLMMPQPLPVIPTISGPVLRTNSLANVWGNRDRRPGHVGAFRFRPAQSQSAGCRIGARPRAGGRSRNEAAGGDGGGGRISDAGGRAGNGEGGERRRGARAHHAQRGRRAHEKRAAPRSGGVARQGGAGAGRNATDPGRRGRGGRPGRAGAVAGRAGFLDRGGAGPAVAVAAGARRPDARRAASRGAGPEGRASTKSRRGSTRSTAPGIPGSTSRVRVMRAARASSRTASPAARRAAWGPNIQNWGVGMNVAFPLFDLPAHQSAQRNRSLARTYRGGALRPHRSGPERRNRKGASHARRGAARGGEHARATRCRARHRAAGHRTVQGGPRQHRRSWPRPTAFSRRRRSTMRWRAFRCGGRMLAWPPRRAI